MLTFDLDIDIES